MKRLKLTKSGVNRTEASLFHAKSHTKPTKKLDHREQKCDNLLFFLYICRIYRLKSQ